MTRDARESTKSGVSAKPPDDAPPSAQGPEGDRHLLKGRFVGALVEDHEAPLVVATGPQASQVAVETAAEILEGDLHGVPAGERGLVDDTGKGSSGVAGIRQHLQDRLDRASGFVRLQSLPGRNSSGEDLRGVELDAMRVARLGTRRESVQLSRDPVRLRLVHRQSTKHEVLLLGVAGRACVVEVQEMDDRRPWGSKKKAAG